MALPAAAALQGAGLGLRRALIAPLLESADASRTISFLELAPENWMQVGGRLAQDLRALAERYPLSAHGLSLSLGGPMPLDDAFLRALKRFLDAHGIADYSEHLSWCSDDGQLYELLPIPFTEAAVEHVAARIRHVQDVLERRIAVENVSTYAQLGGALDEAAFTRAVVERADCLLLLDVNNVHVNSVNHGGDALRLLHGLPLARVRSLHVAGHQAEAPDLLVDTHGAAVADPVWALLAEAYARCGPLPTTLERDFNLPPLPELLDEAAHIRRLQAAAATTHVSAHASANG